MALYPFAAAHLAPDDPCLPAIPDEPCVCGHDRLHHNDRFDDSLADWDFGAGPCQHCPCAGYQAAGVDDVIASMRKNLIPDYLEGEAV